MTDRSSLALQLTDAIRLARTAVEHAGDQAFRAYGLSHRAHAALVAVDAGGSDGARPKEVADQLACRAPRRPPSFSVSRPRDWSRRPPTPRMTAGCAWL